MDSIDSPRRRETEGGQHHIESFLKHFIFSVIDNNFQPYKQTSLKKLTVFVPRVCIVIFLVHGVCVIFAACLVR